MTSKKFIPLAPVMRLAPFTTDFDIFWHIQRLKFTIFRSMLRKFEIIWDRINFGQKKFLGCKCHFNDCLLLKTGSWKTTLKLGPKSDE